MSPLARFMIALIDRYQRAGGGERLLVTCNFEPSCSRYTREAIERYGAFNGARLGYARIKRCNRPDVIDPIADPVPSKEEYLKHHRIGSTMREDELEEKLRELAASLPGEQRKKYYVELGRRVKDPDTYAALSYAMMLGIRHFYLGRVGRGLLDVFVVLFGIALLIMGNLLGLLMLLVIFTLDVVGLIRSQKIVKRYNLERSKELLEQIGGISVI